MKARRIAWVGISLALVLGAALAVALRFLPIGLSKPPSTSLAIIPFDTDQASAEQRLLASGLSHDLLLRLGTLSAIQQISRDQVLNSQAAATPPYELAKELGAETLITGEVSTDSDRIHLELRVDDAHNRVLIARLSLDGSKERVFDLQRRVASEIAKALAVPVRFSEKRRFRRDPTRSLRAWDYATRGQDSLENLMNPRGLLFAIDLFRQAIQHDPEYDQAHVGLSEALWLDSLRREDPAGLADAEAAARRALALQPRSPAAAVALTKILQSSTPKPTTRILPTIEIEALPKPDEALRSVATGLFHVGKLETAEAALRTAVSMADDFWLNWYALGQLLAHGGRFGEAELALRQASQKSPPDLLWPQESLIAIQLTTGDLAGAIETFESINQAPDKLELIQKMATAHNSLGNSEAAKRLFLRALELDPQDRILHREMGDLLARLHLDNEATEHYLKGLELSERDLVVSPDDPQLQLSLAVFAAKTSDCPRALTLATTLRRHHQVSTDLLGEMALVFAVCEEEELAVEALQQALGLGLPPEWIFSRSEFQLLILEPELRLILSDGESPSPTP